MIVQNTATACMLLCEILLLYTMALVACSHSGGSAASPSAKLGNIGRRDQIRPKNEFGAECETNFREIELADQFID